MDGLYYLAMLIGIAWLAIWSIAPEDLQARFWWPFDRIERDPSGAEKPPPAPPAPRRGTRAPAREARPGPARQPGPARPWRRGSGG
jgi:hypothetical protein